MRSRTCSSPARPDYVREALAVQKLLVANRGEIALRIFRTCREMGIATVAVVAPDDLGVAPRALADETVEIRSYLDSEEHIRAAKQSGADAIHPGYGFLAENADFAEAVDAAGLVFVGPSPDALRTGGDKLEAKRIAAESGVPVGADRRARRESASRCSSRQRPAAAGAGCASSATPAELDEALAAAKREAKAAFGDDRVFCERYVERPRHVEIQLLARRARRGARARRARVLDPAAPSEGARGVSLHRARPRLAQRDERGRRRASRGRSATRARARSSSCSTAATSTSWS